MAGDSNAVSSAAVLRVIRVAPSAALLPLLLVLVLSHPGASAQEAGSAVTSAAAEASSSSSAAVEAGVPVSQWPDHFFGSTMRGPWVQGHRGVQLQVAPSCKNIRPDADSGVPTWPIFEGRAMSAEELRWLRNGTVRDLKGKSVPRIRALLWLPFHGLGNVMYAAPVGMAYALISGRRLLRCTSGPNLMVMDTLCSGFLCGVDPIPDIGDPTEFAPRLERIGVGIWTRTAADMRPFLLWDRIAMRWTEVPDVSACIMDSFGCTSLWCVESKAVQLFLREPRLELKEVIEESFGIALGGMDAPPQRIPFLTSSSSPERIPMAGATGSSSGVTTTGTRTGGGFSTASGGNGVSTSSANSGAGFSTTSGGGGVSTSGGVSTMSASSGGGATNALIQQRQRTRRGLLSQSEEEGPHTSDVLLTENEERGEGVLLTKDGEGGEEGLLTKKVESGGMDGKTQRELQGITTERTANEGITSEESTSEGIPSEGITTEGITTEGITSERITSEGSTSERMEVLFPGSGVKDNDEEAPRRKLLAAGGAPVEKSGLYLEPDFALHVRIVHKCIEGDPTAEECKSKGLHDSITRSMADPWLRNTLLASDWACISTLLASLHLLKARAGAAGGRMPWPRDNQEFLQKLLDKASPPDRVGWWTMERAQQFANSFLPEKNRQPMGILLTTDNEVLRPVLVEFLRPFGSVMYSKAMIAHTSLTKGGSEEEEKKMAKARLVAIGEFYLLSKAAVVHIFTKNRYSSFSLKAAVFGNNTLVLRRSQNCTNVCCFYVEHWGEQ